MSFAIANNMLAIDLGISPQTTMTTTWNNSKNPEDGSSNMNHPKKCSYTILESLPENKWGVVVKAWANKVLSKTKMCSC